MVLPIFRPISMRNHFSSNEIYVYLEQLLFTQIFLQLDKDPTEFQVDDALPFLSAYFHDLAVAILDHRVNSSINLSISSQLHDAACELLFQAATSVPLQNRELESALLVDASIVHSHFQNESITAVLDMAITSAKATEILAAIQGAIQSSFGSKKSPSETLALLHRTTLINTLVLDSGNEHILDAFASPGSGLLGLLGQIYNILLPSISQSLPGSVDTAGWGLQWLGIKVSILDSLHAALKFSAESNGGITRCCNIMFSLIESGPSPPDSPTALIDATLPMDYQKLFKYKSTLLELIPQSNEPKLDRLKSTLDSYSSMTQMNQSFINRLGVTTASSTEERVVETTKLSDRKGKGVDRQQEEEDASIDIAISQVLDILPDQDLQFLRRCLAHPNFKGEGGTERLISSLLEGSIPIEISAEPESSTAQSTDFGLEAVNSRRNIFDGQEMDLSSLRFGKKQNDGDDLLQDRSWLQEMKADILRRAEAASEDDDEEPSRFRRTKGDVEYIDDDFEDLDGAAGSVNVAGDGETSDGNDDEQENSIETTLELAYIENPKLFDRDSATRKSEARARLIAKTGWSHEQLEGWRIMLDRNPRKLKILQKHEFKGNKPQLQSGERSERDEPRQEGKEGRGRGGGRGGGKGDGRGRGRGRGTAQQGSDGSKADAAKERAWKERSGNRQRQRGHDKKFTRGGPPES